MTELSRRALLAGLGVVVVYASACGSRTDLALPLGRLGPGAGGSAASGGAPVGGHSVGGAGLSGGATPGTGGTGGSGGAAGAGGRGGAGNAGGGVVTGQVISESADTVLEAETHLAVSDDGAIAVAWIGVPAGPNAFIGYTFSLDGGATFTPPVALESPGGRDGSDPVLAVDPAGGFYMTWVAFKRDNQGNPFDMRVFVAHAAKGATTFDAPVAVSAPDANALLDKPWITVTRKGTAVVTFSRQSDASLALVASRSADGVTWQEGIVAEDASFQSFRNLAYLCAQKQGDRIYAVYPRAAQDVQAISLAYSDDEGATWSQETSVALAAKEPLAYEDPSCVAEGDDVFVLYGVANEPPSVDTTASLEKIRIAHSSDGGATFPERFDAHDAAAAPRYLLPAVGREADGSLDVVYYAGDLDGDPGAFRFARKPVGKAAFDPSVVLDNQLTFNVQRGSPLWLGDYVGVAWRGGRYYAAYATNASGFSHIAFATGGAP